MEKATPLAPPPRAVPVSLRLRVLFGGLLNTIGWLLLAVGGPTTIVFVQNSEWWTRAEFRGSLVGTTGVVQAVREAPVTIRKEQVYAVTFSYDVDGVAHEAISYSVGDELEPGRRYEVEYSPDAPHVARIRGLRSAPFSSRAVVALVLPLAAVCLVVGGAWAGRRRLRMLRRAHSASAELVDAVPTNQRSGRSTWFEFLFRFVDVDGEPRQFVHRALRGKVPRGDHHHLLYVPDRADCVLVSSLPGRPSTRKGRWLGAPFGELLRVLALPIAAVVLMTIARGVKL